MKVRFICLFILSIYFKLFAQAALPINPSSMVQAETHIAVNPTNPDNIISTSIVFDSLNTTQWVAVYFTFNGGENWTAYEPFTASGAADPHFIDAQNDNYHLTWASSDYIDDGDPSLPEDAAGTQVEEPQISFFPFVAQV